MIPGTYASYVSQWDVEGDRGPIGSRTNEPGDWDDDMELEGTTAAESSAAAGS